MSPRLIRLTGGRINHSKIILKCFLFLFDNIRTFICHILTFSEELCNMLFIIITGPLFIRCSRENTGPRKMVGNKSYCQNAGKPTIKHIIVIKMFPFVSSLIQTLVTTGLYSQKYPESATFIIFTTDRMVPCFT